MRPTPKRRFYLDWSRRIPGSLVGRNTLIVSRSKHIWRFLLFDRTAYKGLYHLQDITQPLFREFDQFTWLHGLAHRYIPHSVAQPPNGPTSAKWVLPEITPEAAFQSLMQDVSLDDLMRPIELADVLSWQHAFQPHNTLRMVELALGRLLLDDVPGALAAARTGLDFKQLYDYETPWRERAQWIVDKLEAGNVEEVAQYARALEEKARAVLPDL